MIVESDAKVLIQMIRKELMHDYSLECILGDIDTLAQRLRDNCFLLVLKQNKTQIKIKIKTNKLDN